MNLTKLTTLAASLSLLVAPSAGAQSITLDPLTQSAQLGSTATVVATVLDAMGNPNVGLPVMFSVFSGPNVGEVALDVTNAAGNASFTVLGDGGLGLDIIFATAQLPSGPLAATPAEIDWDAVVTSENNGCPGTNGVPMLMVMGEFVAETQTKVTVAGALPGTEGLLLIGLQPATLMNQGCTLLFDPVLLLAITTDSSGSFRIEGRWPAGLVAGQDIFFQAFLVDPGSPTGFSSTNTVIVTAP
jgi:hypothetical protein